MHLPMALCWINYIIKRMRFWNRLQTMIINTLLFEWGLAKDLLAITSLMAQASTLANMIKTLKRPTTV
ncbi:hypothetical protein EPI10_020252 [Gossypium australe]|uniref:Uncharacterized protein n=1 Tax=Gossypium australe TaxID=47621 RepID=A0A5B6WF27_9ROSI|nr:hypothetical protein EPI10_020252 [Gossypium australe]